MNTLNRHQDIAQHLIHPKYRPDIDGLRAVAVLSVVGYHAFPSMVGAGFIGVDIFFVISGYLISSIILSSLIQNRFSLLEFYIKRVRRIFPALGVVLLASLTYAWSRLFPAEFVSLGKHIFAGAAFISNIVFWRESGYFDTASDLKPMLHLWSLGIEEQFYVIWPLLLLMVFKLGKRYVGAVLLLILFSSFILNVGMAAEKPTATFFLPVTRFWELSVGALLAYITVYRGGMAHALGRYFQVQNQHVFQLKCNEAMSWLGAFLLITAFLLIDNKSIFPGWLALLPTFAAFFAIAAGGDTLFNRHVLAARPLVAIGLISYPLYLWHWPLLAFSHIEYGEILQTERLLLVLASILLAWGTYRWVEKPLRASKGGYVTASLIFIIVTTGCFGLLIFKGIVTNDRDDERTNFVRQFDNSEPAYPYLSDHHLFEAYRSDCDFLNVFTKEAKETIAESCYTPTTKKTVFIWGDSHAQQLNYGLSKTLPASISLLQVATSGCNPSIHRASRDFWGACNKSNQFALETLERIKPDVVLLAQRNGHEQTDWDEIARKLKQIGVKNVILVGPVPEWQPDLNKILARKLPYAPHRLTDGLDASSFHTDSLLKTKYQNDDKLRYVSPMTGMCNQDGCITYLGADPLNGITTFDYGHLTANASLYLAQVILAPAVLKATGLLQQDAGNSSKQTTFTY